MSIPMDNGMANSNQMKGGNPIAGLRLGAIAARRKGRSKSSGGGQQFDKAYFENLAELETHKEQLRRTGVESDANVRDLEQMRSYGGSEEGLAAGGGHIGGKVTASRNASRITDENGRVIGEIGVKEQGAHGKIETSGFRLPSRENNDSEGEAPASTGPTLTIGGKPVEPGSKRPDVGQQMENIQTSGPRQTFLGIYKDQNNPDEVNNNWMLPVATDKVNADRDPDGSFTMGTGPGVRRDGGQKGFDFPMRGELDKWNSQQDVQADQGKAHLEATHPQKEKPKGGKPKAAKPKAGKDKVDVATPVAEAIGGGVGAAIGAAVGAVAGPVGTAAGAAGGRAIGSAVGGAVKKKVKPQAPSSGTPKAPKP